MSKNKRIVKNAGFLYIRMFLIVVVSLYTSRVLLQVLGVNDFGLYNIVGGIVAIFSSLRGLFASSIQRFLNFEMGKSANNILRKIFSMSVMIHLIICLLVIIFSETIGLWFLNNKLNIAPERLYAAQWAFHFSVLTVLLTIMNTPFDALIIAHERMSIYAFISIIEAVLKLLIVFALSFFGFDKLILYAILIFSVAIIIRSISAMYCRKNFEECRYVFIWDKKLFKSIGSFSGWNFFGQMSFMLVNQGTNILLNIFGGVTANAARAISYQVKGAMTNFTQNIIIAAKPQIIKLYAQNKLEELFKLIFTTSKLSFFLMFILVVPFIIYTEAILEIWLSEVPIYAVSFVKLIMLYLLFRIFHNPLDSLFIATGRIKLYQTICSFISILSLPISFIFLKLGFCLDSIFIVMISIEIVRFIIALFLAKKNAHLPLKSYFINVIKSCFIVVVSSCLFVYIFLQISSTSNSIILLILNIITCIIIISICIFSFGLSKSERNSIKGVIIKLIKR